MRKEKEEMNFIQELITALILTIICIYSYGLAILFFNFSSDTYSYDS